MDKVRYGLAILMLVSVPPAIGLWYAIHPFARFWRRFGAAWTYAALSPAAIAMGWLAWALRDTLLAADFGTQPALIAFGVVCGVAGGAVARQRRKHLTQRILVGVPELSPTDKGRLLTDGIYARVRNPRYIEFLILVLAYVAVANYAATWILFLLTVPATHLLVLMEERELRDRFGLEYVDYCQRVPRWIPRGRKG